MEPTNWHKQLPGEPLYPDIIWSLPENKSSSGKLTIIGGNQFGFGAPGNAYTVAQSAGAGVVQVLLPDGIKKVVKTLLPDAEYAPSTPSGSFARKALDSLLSLSSWSDGVLLAGDLGRNSETAMMLETYVEKYTGPLTITQDAVEYFKETPLQLVERTNTLIVLSLSQLQKIFINTPSIIPITLGMGSLQLVEALQSYTKEHSCMIVTMHNDLLYVASDGDVSTTKTTKDIWRVETATVAAVLWMQVPNKPFQAITTAVLPELAELRSA